jgi:hypothetical protein
MPIKNLPDGFGEERARCGLVTLGSLFFLKSQIEPLILNQMSPL